MSGAYTASPKFLFAMLIIGAVGLNGCMMHAMHGADHRHEQDAAMESSPPPDANFQAGQEKIGTAEETQETRGRQTHDRRRKGLWILGGIGMAAMMALMIL